MPKLSTEYSTEQQVNTGTVSPEEPLETMAALLASGPHHPGWVERLEAATLALDDALVHHRDSDESENGTLARVAAKKPGVVPRVEDQVQEHCDLLRRAARLRGALRAAREFESWDGDRLALQARVLHDAVQLHLMLDTELFSEAFLMVEGGESG
jgi:hypothetical protein